MAEDCPPLDLLDLPGLSSEIACVRADPILTPVGAPIVLPPVTGGGSCLPTPVNHALTLWPTKLSDLSGYHAKLESPDFGGHINQWHTIQDSLNAMYGILPGYQSQGGLGGANAAGLAWCSTAANWPITGVYIRLFYNYQTALNQPILNYEHATISLNLMQVGVPGQCKLHFSGGGVTYSKNVIGPAAQYGQASVTNVSVSIANDPFVMTVEGTLAYPASYQDYGAFTGVFPHYSYHPGFFDGAACPINLLTGSFKMIVAKEIPT